MLSQLRHIIPEAVDRGCSGTARVFPLILRWQAERLIHKELDEYRTSGKEWFHWPAAKKTLFDVLDLYELRQIENDKKPIDALGSAAEIAGLSRDTVAKAKLISKFADDETKQKLRQNKISIHRVAKDIKESRQKTKRAAERKKAVRSMPKTTLSNIHVGDFRKMSDVVPDGSLSLIFTDPPYDKKSVELYDGLGKFAADKLCEGGSLLCYVGQTQLPLAMDHLWEHLRYWWTVCCLHSGGANLMNEYGIRCGWKAVLWFVKDTRGDKETIVSDVMSGGREKSHHDWQQSESEAAYWIKQLCPRDGIVCDPFLGGGTTAAAAKRLKRRWVGFEIDKEQARMASVRVEKVKAR